MDFLEGCRFLFFAKKLNNNIGKKISGKYSQKNFHQAKESATEVLKNVSKGVIQKIAKQIVI